MCGIAGIWHKDGKPVDERTLVSMRETLAPRGPDDAGVWRNGSVGLAHRRLSVIDLTPSGHQPMVDVTTGVAITYNGEVYNYRQLRDLLEEKGYSFSGTSDTEVVLKAYLFWGRECVSRFEGMFAFGIWDPREHGLFLARDRVGIKPLYYSQGTSYVIFGSRLKTLLEYPGCPRELDAGAVAWYLSHGYFPSPVSPLSGVKKVNPGTTLWITRGGIEESIYWSVARAREQSLLTFGSFGEARERLHGLLRTVVSGHMVSDVPVGVFLSGGVDSSLIAALMKEHTDAVLDSFTIGFGERRFDESEKAREVARQLGIRSNVLTVTSDSLREMLSAHIDSYDEPFADSSSIPTMALSRFARKSVTVVLSGDGADELFFGYHPYAILAATRGLFFLPPVLRKCIAQPLLCVPHRYFRVMRDVLVRRDLAESQLYLRRITDRMVHKGKGPGELWDGDLGVVMKEAAETQSDPVRMSDWDIRYYLCDDILQKLDVASMSVGLEARVPFLDHRVIEFAVSLPLRYKIGFGAGKKILKRILDGYCSPRISRMPKRGFVVPMAEWFRGPLRDMLQDALEPDSLRRCGFLDENGVADAAREHLTGAADHSRLLWALFCFVRWHKAFIRR